MGGDGGSIPGRDVLVKTKTVPKTVTKNERNHAIWYHCALSQVPLSTPIVICGHGRLYNKESIIEKLLDSSKYPKEASRHIKRLSDVREVNLNKAKELTQYCCPILDIEMNGAYQFVCFWSCGCMISKKALDEIKGDNCLNCEKKFSEKDIIYMNPTDEDFIRINNENTEKRSRRKKRKAPDVCSAAILKKVKINEDHKDK